MHGVQFRKNDLVLIAEDIIKPLFWKKGSILEKLSGNEDITRVVKLKTARVDIIRSVMKLRKLPVEHQEQ